MKVDVWICQGGKRWFHKAARAAEESVNRAVGALLPDTTIPVMMRVESRPGEPTTLRIDPHSDELRRFEVVVDGTGWTTVTTATALAAAQLASALLAMPGVSDKSQVAAALSAAGLAAAPARTQRARRRARPRFPVHTEVVFPQAFSLDERDRFDALLEQALGSDGEVSGSGAGILGVTLDVDLRSEAAIDRVLDTLRRHGAPEGTRLRCGEREWSLTVPET